MLSPSLPAVDLPHLHSVPLPPVMRAKLALPSAPPVADVAEAVQAELTKCAALSGLGAGAEVAVAVGSRGVANIDVLARTTVRYLRDLGLEPYIVPAMGSHGGGTADGQVAVLAHLGVTDETVGAPVRATMDVVTYGTTSDGVPCAFDSNAAGADAIILLARVKAHTSFDRPIESGLTKMVAVGLGKAEGARNVHRLGARGYSEVLPALARIALANAPIVYGIAVVENADHQLVTVDGVTPEAFAAADARLLTEAKSMMARLPFSQIDVLVVEQIGKEISGTGMDYAVTGRTDMRGIPNPPKPYVHKLVALGLTAATDGNGVGLGVADFTTLAATNALDLKSMYMNVITSTFVEKARIPLALATEKEAIQAALATCWRLDPENTRYCQIRSTLHLDEVLVSPGLFADVADASGVEALSEPTTLRFDETGRLLDRFSS